MLRQGRCKDCGVVMRSGDRGPVPTYCPHCRRRRMSALSLAGYYRRVGAVPERACLRCGKVFRRRRRTALYCGPECCTRAGSHARPLAV